MLTASLFALFNAARGGAYITHWMWLVIVASITMIQTLSFIHTALVMWCVIVCTILDTTVLLRGNDGDPRTIMWGTIRALPIIPAVYFLDNPWGYLLLGQGLIYYLFSVWNSDKRTRASEGVTGLLLGVLI